MKQVNEIQPTKVAVVFKVKFSNLQEPSSRSKAAYWGLELFLSKGVQNKIHPSSICLWHNELLERGVSRVANVVVSQLKHTRINYRISSSFDPVIIPTLVEYVRVVTGQICGVKTVLLFAIPSYAITISLMWSLCYYKWWYWRSSRLGFDVLLATALRKNLPAENTQR